MVKDNPEIFDAKLQAARTDLRKESLRGGAATLTSQGLSFLITVGSTMILARLLTPQDFGIISMVAAITGFATIFSDLGLSKATIQSPKITHAQVSLLFWINVALGGFITLVVALSSPTIALFYQTPQLLWITLVLSLNFIITGFGIQHRAILNRQLRFWDIAKIQLFSRLSGVCAAIAMAFFGFRYWALVANTLVASFCGVVLTWLLVRWSPGLPQRNSGTRPMLRFGADIAGFNVVNYFSRNLDNILIGKFYGGATLGFYSKAYQLLMLPITNLREPLTKVALPALSRLQDDPGEYRRYYLKFVSLLAFLTIPLVVYMFICADRIIALVLGPQWLEAADLFRILAFVALLQPAGSTRGTVMLSLGKSRRFFKLGVAGSTVTIAGFVLGLPWGAEGVAVAYAVTNNILLWVASYYAFKGTPIKLGDFVIAIYRPLLAGLLAGVGGYFLLLSLADRGHLLVLFTSFVLFVPVYMLIFSAISGGWRELSQYFSYGRMIFSKS